MISERLTLEEKAHFIQAMTRDFTEYNEDQLIPFKESLSSYLESCKDHDQEVANVRKTLDRMRVAENFSTTRTPTGCD
jgi:hypothetical protein